MDQGRGVPPLPPGQVGQQQPQQPQQAGIPQVQPQLIQLAHMAMNWSYFKLEFSGKPEEDTEAYKLRTID